MAEEKTVSVKEKNYASYLNCKICSNLYDKPTLLRCMHTFCEFCIRSKLHNGNGNIFICPICGYQTMVGDKSMLLWNNQIIEKKIEKSCLSRTDGGKVIHCNECEREKAAHFCIDCTLRLCDDCASHHKRCVRFDNHKIVDIDDVSHENSIEKQILICAKHEQKLRYFCDVCQISTCCDCKLSKIHKNHSFHLMDEIIDEKREELRNLISEMKTKTAKYETYIQKVNRFVLTADEKRKASIKEIEDTFNNLIEILQSEKEILLRWINDTFTESENSLKRAEDELKIVYRMTNYLEELISYPKHETSDVILEGIKVLKEDIKDMGEVTDYDSNQHRGNIFHVNPCSREVITGTNLEMIQIAMRQISFLQQTKLPKRISHSTQYTPQTFLKKKGFSHYETCPYQHSHGCTYLPDNRHFLPPNVYLPHAFTFREMSFQK